MSAAATAGAPAWNAPAFHVPACHAPVFHAHLRALGWPDGIIHAFGLLVLGRLCVGESATAPPVVVSAVPYCLIVAGGGLPDFLSACVKAVRHNQGTSLAEHNGAGEESFFLSHFVGHSAWVLHASDLTPIRIPLQQLIDGGHSTILRSRQEPLYARLSAPGWIISSQVPANDDAMRPIRRRGVPFSFLDSPHALNQVDRECLAQELEGVVIPFYTEEFKRLGSRRTGAAAAALDSRDFHGWDDDAGLARSMSALGV